MPIYEFLCPDCATIFNFFSARIDPAARPACPRCGRADLERRPSRFATGSRTKPGGAGEEDSDPDDPLSMLDDERMDSVLDELGGELEGMDESAGDDPKQLVRFLQKFGERTGLEPGEKMREMLAKLESGADPDSLESEFGGEGADDDFDFADFFRKAKSAAARRKRPRVDETLYFL